MMLAILAEAALRSFLLGSVVWIVLTLCRVQNPHVHMTSWVMVLAASLSMPLLMHWTTVTVTVPSLPLSAPESFWIAEDFPSQSLQLSQPSGLAIPPPGGRQHAAVNWWAVATAVYALVSGLLLLRLLIGIHLTWRLARAAKPMRETRGPDSDVRISRGVGGPVTFGSTILLPSQWIDWDLRKREAVLAHEGAHVANRDFYILLLASLNRAVFWFSPFAWWQLARLAELAEIISDANAIEVLDDRLSYAEVLLDLVQSGRPRLAGLDMARASTVHARVERILTAAAMPARVGWRKRIGIVAALVPVVVVSSGTIAYRSAPAAIDASAPEQSAASVPWLQDVDFYAVNPRSVFAIFRQGDELSAQITGQHKLRLSPAPDRSYSYPALGGLMTFTLDGEPPSELTLHQNGRDLRAMRIAAHRADAEVNAMVADQYTGWYQLTPGRVLAVTREGERMQVRETGRAKFEVKADGADAFSSAQDALVVFIRDGQGTVTQALVEDPTSGARLAPRIDADRARGIEEAFARRIAEIPDRFHDQAPAPGSKEALQRGIADMQRGAPNYDRMSAGLAAKIRQQAPQLQAMLQSLGAVSSIFFRGVGPGGYDIYGVKFANGSADLRMLLDADGKVEDILFHPSGNGEPGRFAACSEEPRLKPAGNGAPITIILYNNSGDDIQLYSLDASGSRTARGTLSDSMTSTFLTTVDSPWIVTDRAGQCLEIMLPGLQTRYHMVERGGGAAEYARRITPLSGSEEMLRQYIEGIARGQPIYDRMTAQLAAQTNQQLPFNRAILDRLGALRALTFRGVTALGADIYVGHFANGSAEWRIGLARDGSIGRIALGPQY